MNGVSYTKYWIDVYQEKVTFPAEKDGSIIPWEIKTHDFNLEKILTQFDIHKGKCLELGCGLGYDSAYLSSLGFDVTAIDISQDVIEKAKLIHNKSNVNFSAMDFLEELPKGKFDIIFDRGFLHNYKSKLKEIFDRVARITNEDAKFILIAGNPNSPILDTCMPPTITISEVEFFSMAHFKILSVNEIEFLVNDNYKSSLGYIFLLERRKYPIIY